MATRAPFNVSILQVNKSTTKHLKPVTSTDIMGSSGQRLTELELNDDVGMSWSGEGNMSSNFNEDGLFSISIFGRIGDDSRDKRFSYVDIKTKVFHPLIYKSIIKLKGLYGGIINSTAYAVWDPELKDFVAADEVVGSTGFNFFLSHWEEIQFKETGSIKRKDRIKLIEKFKPIALTDRILIMPAGLRDVRVVAGSRLEFDEINDIYRKIVGISKLITPNSADSDTTNYSRLQIQKAFNEIYIIVEKMLSGKSGFIQNKWAKRRVFNSTRNVLSAMNTSKAVLGETTSFKATDTLIGLYQVMRGALPLTIHLLRTGYLAKVFGSGNISTTATLIDPVTLRSELVDLTPTTKDMWTTIDGLGKIINSFQDTHNRHKPVMIEGRYIALIYKGPDKTFRVFSDIEELPDHLDRADVYPITLVELFYLSGYTEWNKRLKVIITRYPVTGIESTYISDLYTRTSMVVEQRAELNEQWVKIGDDHIAGEFPTRDPDSFMDSLVVSIVKLEGLGGDYDGDLASALIVYSDESIELINSKLGRRETYINPDGNIRSSASVDTVNLVLRNMTGNYPKPGK